MALSLREEPLTDSELPYEEPSRSALVAPEPEPVRPAPVPALAPPSRVSPIQSQPLTDNELPFRFRATRGGGGMAVGDEEAPYHEPPRRSPHARYRQLEDENPDLYDAVNNAARNIGVPPSDLAAVVYASSGNDPEFRKNGRIGYGGLTSNDARELDPEGNLDINNPIQNLYLSAIKLKTLKRAFGEGPEAIGAYYYGRDAMSGVLARHGDDHASHLPSEGFGPINRYYGADNSPVGAVREAQLQEGPAGQAGSQADAGMQRQPLSPGPTPQMGAYTPRRGEPLTYAPEDDTGISAMGATREPERVEQSTAVQTGQAVGAAIRRGVPIAKDAAQQAGQAVAAAGTAAAQGVMQGGGQLSQALKAGAVTTGRIIDDVITGISAGAQGRRPEEVAAERSATSKARGTVAEAAIPPAITSVPPRDVRGMGEQAAQEDTGMQRFGPAAPEPNMAVALRPSPVRTSEAATRPQEIVRDVGAEAATQADAGIDRPLPGRVVPPEELKPPAPSPAPEPAKAPAPALAPPGGKIVPQKIPGAPDVVSPAPAPEPPPPASPAPRPRGAAPRAGSAPTKQQPPPAATTTGRGAEPSYAEPTPAPTGEPTGPQYAVTPGGAAGGGPGAIAAPGTVAARPAPGPVDRFNSSPSGLTPQGIVRAADNGGADGVLTYLSRAPRGMAMTEAWDHAQDLLARSFIIKGDLKSAAMVPAYIHSMKHAGAMENLAKGIAAMESGDMTTAAQYLARSHAYVSDGTVIGFQVIGNQIVGQRYDEQTHDKSGKPFVVTPAGLRSYAMAYSDLDKFVSNQNAERQTTETGRHNREEERLKGRQIDETAADRAQRRTESAREFDIRQKGVEEQREYNRLKHLELQQQKQIEEARKDEERNRAKALEVDKDIQDIYYYDPDTKSGPKDISGKLYDRPNAIKATSLFRAIRLYNRDIGTQQAQDIEQNVMAKRYTPVFSDRGTVGFVDSNGTVHAEIPHSAWRAYLPPLPNAPVGPQRPVVPAPGVR